MSKSVQCTLKFTNIRPFDERVPIFIRLYAHSLLPTHTLSPTHTHTHTHSLSLSLSLLFLLLLLLSHHIYIYLKNRPPTYSPTSYILLSPPSSRIITFRFFCYLLIFFNFVFVLYKNTFLYIYPQGLPLTEIARQLSNWVCLYCTAKEVSNSIRIEANRHVEHRS